MSKELIPVILQKLEANQLSASDINEIKYVINYCDHAYYVLSEQKITDYQYDLLFKELKGIEGANPELLTADSPSQRVAYAVSEDFETIPHLTPMLSLDNSYNLEDIEDFGRKARELSGEEELTFAVEPKFDGAGISLVYEHDQLVRALTRGNGTAGEEITNNARVIRTVPLSIPMSKMGIHRLEIRGEVMISKAYFEIFNEDRVNEGIEVLANTRNAASGSLRMKESAEVAKRGLEAFMYQVSLIEDKDGNDLTLSTIKTQSNSTQLLFDLGFRSPYKEMKVCKSAKEVHDYCVKWEAERDTYGYEIDGMVLKVDSIEKYEKIGYTAHHPKWAIAYKFKAKQAQSTLLDVEWQVGRTGTITPVAKLEPVGIAGVTVSSVTMFNEDFILDKDIRLGDTLKIERAGDVIPYIVGPVKDLRDGTEQVIDFPKDCPACEYELFQEEGEAAWRCISPSCGPQLIERLKHFVSKNALDIMGMGASIVERFQDLGYLNGLTDIFKLPYDEIRTLEGFGAKSVDKLEAGVEAAKTQTLYRILFGIGIRHVGETTAKNLVKKVDHISAFKNWTVEELEGLEDIGPKVADSIYQFFHNEESLALIEELESLGMVLSHDRSSYSSSSILEGKTFLFTGTLQQLGRKEAQALVEEHEGKNISSVSKHLDYLVIGEKAGSKLKKAQAIETITIITESEFIEMIGGGYDDEEEASQASLF